MDYPISILEYIKADSLKKMPEESCGLLMKKNNDIIVYSCRNIADNKLYNFLIAPTDYIAASKLGKIFGVYHSHTQPDSEKTFTLKDKIFYQNENLSMILYSVNEDQFIFSDRVCDTSQYIGHSFKFGARDCLTMVETFYRNEFRIYLPIRHRDDSTMEKNPNLIIDNITNFGFCKISKEDSLRYGDVIICKGIKSPSHLMIYIGNNQILHHRYNKYSTVENYNHFYKMQTFCIVRHNSLWN